ncbi:MAG: S-layer family protein [Verrucomicrobiaceae bacterium]|nr:MAG: S-layer family protein [Verrucomicrobiaceae bacterium]
MKLTRSSFILGTSLTAMMLSYTGVQAAGIWDGTTGNYNDAVNWDNDAVPGPINVDVSNNGTVIINTNQTTNDILTGTLGTSITSNWQQDAGTVTMGGGWFRMGTVANAGGAYNLNGGVLNVRGQINVGEANGTAGATAILNIAGGTFNNTGAADRQNIIIGGRLSLANGGKGQLNISSGVLNNSSELWVGAGTGSNGVMNISGGTVNQAAWLAVGRSNGTGVLNMTGGTFNKTTANAGHAAIIGASGTGSGIFNQNAGAFNIQAGETWIGEGATGTWNVSGGTATLQLLTLGQGGVTGTLNMQGATGLTGSLANGGGTQVITATTLRMGNNATAVAVANLDGGTLVVNNIAEGNTAATSTFNFNGGTLRARQNNGNFMSGLNNAFVKAGGANIDSNGFAITIGQNLLTDVVSTGGGLTKTGANILTLTGANTYTGNTNINAGAISFQKTQSLPGYTTVGGSGATTNVASGAGIVVGVGGTGSFTAADVDAIRANTSGKFNLAGGSSIGIDTTDATVANGNANDTFNYGSVITDTVNGTLGFIKAGANSLTLSSSNSYTGATSINGGTLVVASLQNGGANSDIGASSAASSNLVMNGGGIRYTGGNATTDRGFTVGGAGGAIDNASNLTFSGQILATGSGSFTKNGAGTLAFTNITGTNTLTGGNSGNALGLVVNNGLLQLGGTSASPLAQTNQINGELIIGTVNTPTSPNAAVEINGGTTTVTSYVGVGRGNGTVNAATSLTLNNNAVVTAGNFAIGYDNGVVGYKSSPTVNFNGTSSFSSAGVFTVGESPNAAGGISTVNVNGGASVNMNSVATNANNIGAVGPAVFNQNGGSVNAVAQITIARDAASVASYNLNGGTLTVPNITKGAGTGTFNFNGGVLKASANSATFVAGVTTNVQEGGAKIDSNGSNITVSTALLHGGVAAIDGGLTKQGNGTLTLTGVSTYTGPTVVSAGTLLVNGSIANTSGITLAAGATLGGSSTNIGGTTTVSEGASISPGNSVGTINLAALDLQGTYNAEITGNGVNDLVNLGAGNLNLGNNSLINILLSYSPSAGDTFDLANFGSFSGDTTPQFAFSQALSGGLTWDTSNFTTNGVITVIPEPSSALLAFAGSALLVRRRRKQA